MIINVLADLLLIAPFGMLLVGVVVFFISRRRRQRAEGQQTGTNEPVD